MVDKSNLILSLMIKSSLTVNMMLTKTLSPKQALNKAYQRQKPFRNEFDNFKENLLKLLNELNPDESEEHNKNYVARFLEKSFYSDNLINTSGKIDLAVYLGKDAKSKVGVIGEVKAPSEKNDMPSKDNFNVKAMHQVILYYLRERIEEKNDDIKNIFITSGYEWFIFDAKLFEKLFYKNNELVKRYKAWAADKKVSNNTDHFYKEIAADFLNNLDAEIEFVHFDLRNYQKELNSKSGNETKLISLYKIFSKPFLLKEQFTNDSNSLDKAFYNELLYIIGLEEVKEGSKKLIRRKVEEKRDAGAIIENTIEKLKSKDTVTYYKDAEKFGEDDEEKLFNIALQLNITWINRILFLKLLEAQLVNYNQGNIDYKFLDTKVIAEYDDLDELFHEVLARKLDERSTSVKEKFKKIPYLNSSLFERSELERNTISIDSLKDRFKISVHHSTVLKDEKDNRFKGELSTLKYLLKFLDAYDFSTESTGEEIQEEGKSLINASVLGLIFEKINGYKEGSFFTPGFITMYMSRETLRRAVVQKFNNALKSSYTDFEELKVEIDRTKEGREKANEIINSLKVCDPAVGSGHFLVSVLNEIITIKSELGLLCYRDGSRVQNYSVEIANDELIITDVESEDIFKYHLNQKGNVIDGLQRMQEAIFHEKQTIIENCLFGVDINPNSVNICRLRLWIELLKNSYYTKDSGYKELETLPNIDINIKQGNSLISRFELGDQVFTKGDKTSLELYKMNVKLYKNATDRDERKRLKDSIEKIKNLLLGMYEDPLNEERKRLRKLGGELTDHQITLGELDGKSEAIKKRLEEKIDKLAKKIVKQEEENELIYRDAFEWRFEFPEVLDEEGNFIGFDCVIGNPPYYSLSKNKDLANYLEEAKFVTYSKSTDIYCIFYERGYQILRANGLLTYITSNSWLRAIYGNQLKQFFKDSMQPLTLLNIEDFQVFDEATVESNIITLQKTETVNPFLVANLSEDYSFGSSLGAYFLENNFEFTLPATTDWVIGDEGETKLKQKIESNSDLLGELDVKINFGIKTGYNAAFIIDEETKQKLISEDKKSAEIIKPILRGRDLKKYTYTFPNLWAICTFPVLDIKIDRYPTVKEYLLTFSQKRLEQTGNIGSRKKTSYDWFETQDSIAYWEDFEKPKIIWGEISDEPKFAYDDENYYAEATTFLMTGENLKYLLAILNSKVSEWYFKQIGTTTGMGTNRWKKYKIELLPIKKASKADQKQIEKLVDEIITLKKDNPKADTSALEREIDELLYKLYRLTEEEIRIVEGG